MMLTGDNGILQRAAEAKEITDIARVEEAANLELANSIIGAKTQQGGATEKTVAQIAEYLKDEGYIDLYSNADYDVKMEESNNITINKYDKNINFEYIKEGVDE